MKETIKTAKENGAKSVFSRARSAILEGGFDDLASAAGELAELIKEYPPATNDNSVSDLVRPLIAIAGILAADRKYLQTAISAYVDAAHYSVGKDDELNKQAIIGILEKAELLPTSDDRIKAYQLAMRESPSSSPIAAFAKHKSKEQKDPVYFRIRSPNEVPRFEESIIEGDMNAVSKLSDGMRCVIRQQSASGEIQYSVVVTRGFSRANLTRAGVLNAQELRRTGADDELDRIVIPFNRLPQLTQRDLDFISRLRNRGIYIDAVHGRIRNAEGIVTSYKFPEGSNADRMRYMGVEAHSITPHEGKIVVPIEQIEFYADPALIGKWNWIPAGGGKLKAHVTEEELPSTLMALQTHGIIPCENNASKNNSVDLDIVVAADDKEQLNKIIQQHILHERSKHLINFAEALPGFAGSIALASYKDACSYFFGLRLTR